LNTLPLVWGILHGPQQGQFDIEFAIPSVCADRLGAGQADIGIVPCAEIPRLGLDILRGTGIASRGPVRSILLVSKTDPAVIRTLAADSSSRTSVMLARIILSQRYGSVPLVFPAAPDLDEMLGLADAALIIGDPALRLDPESLPYRVFDLGWEWEQLTGLPMVFAVWAGRPDVLHPHHERLFLDSYHYGAARLDEILDSSERDPAIPRTLAEGYLKENVRFELGPREYQGMELFLRYCAEIGASESPAAPVASDTLVLPHRA
jgi:predicted solute-binding protein